jgi:hypothetical protein
MTEAIVTETPYQKWYRENSKRHNASRRKRYAKDPKYRNTQLEMARARRVAQQKEPRPEGLTTPAVAQLIGRHSQTIRSWEQKGLIPNAKTDRGYRLYQPHHVNLLRGLANYLEHYRTNRDKASTKELKAIVKNIKEKW